MTSIEREEVMTNEIHKEIKFGTDGWRGVIADNFTFKNVAIIGQAIADWLKNDPPVKGDKVVALGYDTRFLSREFAETIACILAKNGFKVFLSKECIPTPALSYGVIDVKGIAGVMITASHNPGKFNGVKIKTAQGGGAPKEHTDKVEALLGVNPVDTMPLKEAVESGKVTIYDFKAAYLKFMKSYVSLAKIKKTKFKVLQDVMHGSGRRILEEVLKGGTVKTELMRADINPWFDGTKPEPVADYLKGAMERMKKEKFDIGLVLDGDADRIAAIMPGGEYVSPQKILGLLILHLIRNKKRKGGVVKTVCGTTMIDNIAKKLGLELYETPVGFKYISDLMVTKQIVAGGEEAGGMGVQDYIPERDGTLAGLLLLEMMVYEKKNFKQLIESMEKEFGRYYYQRCDLSLGDGKYDSEKFKAMKELAGKKVVDVNTKDGVKLLCEDGSWLMLRPSGTEPIVRAYSEAKSIKRAKDLIAIGESLLRGK
jgi:phosphomannomutase